jgi:hypothetical protein
MTRILALTLSLALTGPAFGQTLTLTCDTSSDRRHCFDHRGYLSTEECSGGTTVVG